ncbi:hypothetical protein [Zobellia sp. B3R18]|uniref:hypothetical protein n=1 Tax=Zobellia sp. B3R18 TaxID=2841568 RepID=UPI001C075516|nr:hypothetical protein [Zobellia sp. B3R18]MBU2975908.1 hypothetical protein [Zobellia sp. B3R18]
MQEKRAENEGELQTLTQARLQLIESDNYSGSDQEEFLVVTDMKTLQKFYSTVNRTRKPGLPVPQVDFSKEVLVIYCAGKSKNSFQPRLFIENETEDQLVLKVENITGNDKTSTSIITPFSVYKLPLAQKNILLQQ